MAILALLALVGFGIGTPLAMEAQRRENVAEEQEARDIIAVEESRQKGLLAQQAEVDKDILAAGDIYNINKKAMNIQGQQIPTLALRLGVR